MRYNPITLEALLIIDTIERRQSYAKAAEELNKATSSLSYVVQKLEEQLNITLFERQGRRAVLTAAGKVVLEDGRHILRASNNLADKAKQVANGWEPRIRIAIESMVNVSDFMKILAIFLEQYPTIEIDIQECVLNGGWDALEHDLIDLIVGAPAPIPLQKNYRAVPIKKLKMLPVISAKHPYAQYADNAQEMQSLLPTIRRVVTHDTAHINVTRSAGLANGQQIIYVQNIDQKINAILAGIGIGHLPQKRIQPFLEQKTLVPINLDAQTLDKQTEVNQQTDNFLVWKIVNKGKALQALTQLIIKEGL